MLPSQARLDHAARIELLTYHRIETERENICPNCLEVLRSTERECYWCGNNYTDKYGVIRTAGSLSDLFGQKRDTSKMTEEDKAEEARKIRARLKKTGTRVKDEITPEDVAAFHARRGR